MIPVFDQNGYLPPGIHPASLDEIDARFGRQSEIRQSQMESLRRLVTSLRAIGAPRLIINGSFVADLLEPKSVDCLILIAEGPRHQRATETELLADLPFLTVEFVFQRTFQVYVEKIFASDRTFRPEGKIEVTSWT